MKNSVVHRWGLVVGSALFFVAGLGAVTAEAAAVTRGPYLQIGTPSSVIVRWRSDVAGDSRVNFGTSATSLVFSASDAAVTTEHVVRVTGLVPDTKYFYSVGSSAATLAGGSDYFFVTAPVVGTPKPTRIWVLGDSGTANANAAAVKNAYMNFAGSRYTDLWLMLGDNAYNSGLDTEYQAAVFNMYPVTLRQSVLWSTIGNHETAQATNPSWFPYLDIFTLPTAGEAGGVPSGTERYYSFDYGNIHFVCLDAMTSDRTTNGAMYAWLDSDLAATMQDWLIAFWHHPPYTKGTHDSDTESNLIQMRQTFLPILESAGVDLVLCGHSHVYERSYLLNGHYGLSTTFTSAMKIDGGSGRTDGTGAYTKPAGLPANQGAVYVVAGSSGQAGTGSLNHPAMFVSMGVLGSFVLDVTSNRLDAKFLRETGATGDYFTIVKTLPPPPNVPPTVAITSPANGATLTQPVNITITADASDSDGTVTQVAFYDGATLLGTDTTAPYSIVLNSAVAGSHSFTAVATDNSAESTTSAAVGITVNPPPNVPPTVAITSPANGASFTQPVNITITADASDSDGTVAQVAFYDGATLIGTDATSPYSIVLNNAAVGSHTLTAVATDNSSASTTSATIGITVASNSVTIPSAPSSLTATASSKSQINLSWTDNSGNEDGFKIERSTTGKSYTQIAQVGAGVTTFANTGLSGGKTYYYRVRAFNTAGNSAYSNVANAKTPRR